MDTTTSFVYLIDANTGVYLGPIGGSLIYSNDGETETVQQSPVPEGAATIDAPPSNAADVLRGFTVTNGAVVGGSWDTSARPAPIPDVDGFEIAVFGVVGDPVAMNGLLAKYPGVSKGLALAQWAAVTALIEAAHTAGDVSDALYAQFKTLATTYHIPLTLS